jgi:hypothetical protein
MEDVVEYAEGSEPRLPAKLYKFKPFSNFSKSYFTGKITLSNPKSLNDPWDCHISPQWGRILNPTILHAFLTIPNLFTPNINDSIRLFNKYSTDWLKFGEKIFKDMDETMRVCSLSAELKNYLLWAHYGESHKGFCIEYDSVKLVEYLRKLSNNDDTKLAEVNYSVNAPLLDPAYMHINQVYRKNLTYKSLHWEPEKEWRLLQSIEGKPQFSTIDLEPGIITGVYFGEKADDWAVWEARLSLKNFDPNIKAFKLKRIKDQFEYEYNPLNWAT